MPETLDPLRTDHCRLANVSEWKPEPDSGCCSARVTADTAHWADFSNTTEAGNNFFFWQNIKIVKDKCVWYSTMYLQMPFLSVIHWKDVKRKDQRRQQSVWNNSLGEISQ